MAAAGAEAEVNRVGAAVRIAETAPKVSAAESSDRGLEIRPAMRT